MFETGVVRANESLSVRLGRRHIVDILSIYFNMKICCVFQGIQERVRNSRGKRVISVRATEVLLHFYSVGSVTISFSNWPLLCPSIRPHVGRPSALRLV